MNEEIWKDIEGYEGLYQVSNLGRVRSLDRWARTVGNSVQLRKGRVMKQKLNNNGYLSIQLYDANHNYNYYFVHRLVAKAFLPNPDNLPEVNHKDENPLNNRVDNLEWCDHKYNINYGKGNERRKNNNINNPKQSKKVYQYTLDKQLVKVWDSVAECMRNGFGSVWHCCMGVYKQHKGYKWSFEPL